MSRGRAVAPFTTLAALAGLGLAGCLAQPVTDDTPIECLSPADCNQAAGEVCDEGICWGDPPAVDLAATLTPGQVYEAIAARAEVPQISVAPDGWFRDADGTPLGLAAAVRVSGRIRAACPAVLSSCTNGLTVPATIRWTRDSGVPDGPRLTDIATPTSDGFEVYLPRPEVETTYTVSVVPSPDPFGPGLPSPANLFPPRQFQVVLTRDDAEVPRDLDLGLTPLTTLTGHLARAGQPVAAGWRVRAEVVDPGLPTSLVSNIAVTDAYGDYTLLVPSNHQVVDVVIEPPPAPDAVPARIRIRDQVVSSSLPSVDVPPFEPVVAVPITVDGTDGAGGSSPVDGATVFAQLDQQIAPGVYLVHEATATTSSGVAAVQLLLGSETTPLDYLIDVVPGSNAELASRYAIPVQVTDVVPAVTPVMLTRRIALTGVLYDEGGFPLTGATVSAELAAAALCQLDTAGQRSAKRLAAAQSTTDNHGEFKLWLDSDLDRTPLTYDLAVEPAAGSWVPSWTFAEQPVAPPLELWLPAAAHVRAMIEDPSGAPAADTVVTIYELTDRIAPCPQATRSGGPQVRAQATSDEEGIVRLILPRLAPASTTP